MNKYVHNDCIMTFNIDYILKPTISSFFAKVQLFMCIRVRIRCAHPYTIFVYVLLFILIRRQSKRNKPTHSYHQVSLYLRVSNIVCKFYTGCELILRTIYHILPYMQLTISVFRMCLFFIVHVTNHHCI